MSASKITSKGQITIPKVIREALGVQSGDSVEFVVRLDGVVEMIARTRPLMSLAGLLGERRLGLSIQDLERGVEESVNAAFVDSLA